MTNSKAAIAYYGVLYGLSIEIIDIEYGINDKVKWRYNVSGEAGRVITSVIKADKADQFYFNAGGSRVYMDQCIRFTL